MFFTLEKAELCLGVNLKNKDGTIRLFDKSLGTIRELQRYFLPEYEFTVVEIV